MSMTYYAVTDDPNELVHWGVKGMRWGVRHDKPRHSGSRSNKPRSIAYKKAQSKLGKMMKSGIKKAEAKWKAYNSPKAKEERFMKKAMQQARTGTLKYGKLTDAQVRRVTDRLALERNARQLGGTENPRYVKRLKMAVGEGIIRGIGTGTGAYIEERFRGRGRTTAEIKADKRKAKYEGRDDVQRRRARNKQTEEFYKTAYEEGDNPENFRYATAKQRAKYLSEIKARNKQNEYAESLQKIKDETIARQRGNLEGARAFVDRDSRRLRSGGSGALARLEASNTAHERRNAAAEKELIRIERQQAAERRRTADLAVTSRKRQRQRKGRR